MAWVKLDDSMPHHPKVMAAGPQAFALDVAGICYSNKHDLDGFIPEASLSALYPALTSPRRWAAKLVEVGRWHPVDGGWRIHDIDDYQPSAESQKAKREDITAKRAAAGRKGGTKSGEVRGSKPEAKTKQTGKQTEEGVASDDRSPVPDPPKREILPTVVSPTAAVESNGRDPYFEAAAAALDLPWDTSDSKALGSIAAKARKGGHPPDEILNRAALHVATFNFPITPWSLNKRWDQLGSKVITATPAERKRVQTELERMRRREQIAGAL